jgi:hypothetical protein
MDDRERFYLTTDDIRSLNVDSLYYTNMVHEVRKCEGVISINDRYSITYDENRHKYCCYHLVYNYILCYYNDNNELLDILLLLTK